VKGVASDALPDAGDGVPLVQVTITVTLPPLFGTKSFATVKLAVFSVFWMLQPAAAMVAVQAPLLEYPAGTASVAVQDAPARKPVTVVENGAPSAAVPEAGVGVPLVQVTLTLTVAALFGTKSFVTVNTPELCWLMIVQDGVPPTGIGTFAQPVWLSM
jgi:hypothetical protein